MNNDFKDIFDVKDLEKSPFRIPKDYFDTLESRILNNVQENRKKEKQTSTWARIIALRPVRWAAACACVLAITTTAYYFSTDRKEGMMANTTDNVTEYRNTYNSNDAFNQAADYTMLDSHDMYMMLADESYY